MRRIFVAGEMMRQKCGGIFVAGETMRQKCGGFLWREGRSIRRSARWREEKRKVASEMAGRKEKSCERNGGKLPLV